MQLYLVSTIPYSPSLARTAFTTLVVEISTSLIFMNVWQTANVGYIPIWLEVDRIMQEIHHLLWSLVCGCVSSPNKMKNFRVAISIEIFTFLHMTDLKEIFFVCVSVSFWN